jgi:hypothetical protein
LLFPFVSVLFLGSVPIRSGSKDIEDVYAFKRAIVFRLESSPFTAHDWSVANRPRALDTHHSRRRVRIPIVRSFFFYLGSAETEFDIVGGSHWSELGATWRQE